mmetsp:Transcript_9057/g.18555  ORF Transcript_9057/g.18555 Transcript_9057/m.18555 type:complete len:280 (-) Transcript_9057:2010-2849(-)
MQRKGKSAYPPSAFLSSTRSSKISVMCSRPPLVTKASHQSASSGLAPAPEEGGVSEPSSVLLLFVGSELDVVTGISPLSLFLLATDTWDSTSFRAYREVQAEPVLGSHLSHTPATARGSCMSDSRALWVGISMSRAQTRSACSPSVWRSSKRAAMFSGFMSSAMGIMTGLWRKSVVDGSASVMTSLSSSSSILSTIIVGGVSSPAFTSASRSDAMVDGICGPMKLTGPEGPPSGVSAAGRAGAVETVSESAISPAPLSLVRKMLLFCTTTMMCDSLTTP